MKEFNRSLAIIIGINQYQSNNIDSLATAKYDAEKLAEILNAQNRQDPYEVTLITDDTDLKPTGENILNILTKTLIKKDLKESDRLLFYFAGHGIARFKENDKEDEGTQGFLVPSDAEYNKPDSLIPMRKVYQSLAQLNCRHLLVILDCCFAGAFHWASTRRFFYTPKKTTKAHYHRFTKFRAWEVITSSAYNQEALDFIDNRGKDKTEGKHSPFAQALFKGLKAEADLNSDGVIVAPELYLFIRDYVEKNSQDRQTPGFFPLQKHDRGEYIFLIPNQELKLEPTPELNPDNNPYRGLNAYDEKHARFFFGRQELIQRLFMQVCRAKRRFTVVLGISGSGKSSLVKAGLIPQLRQEQDNLISAGILTESILEVVPYFPLKYLPINYNYQWQILETMRPGVTPFKELIRTFALLATNDISVKEVKNNPEKLINLINEWSKNNPKHKLLLVIDQFEELITQAPKVPSKEEEKKENWLVDKIKSIFKSGKQKETRSKSEEVQPEWQQFLEFLVNMIQNCPQLSIVVTLRSDFEPRFAESVLKPYWNRFIVRPMRRDELTEVVEAPATEMALYFEPANLVDLLVDEVNQMPGALPLLSFTLSELYIKLYEEWKGGVKSDRSLTIDQAFEKQGGVAGSLTRRANEEYEQIAKLDFNSKRLLFRGLFDNISSNLLFINVFLFEHEIGNLYQVTMGRVMLRMVEIEGGEAVRRRVLKSELTYSNKEENKRVKTVLNCLVEARLIVTGKDAESGEPYYEPAHDFLVRGWDKLQQWIDEEQKQGNLSLQRRLTPAAEEYFYKRGSLWNADPRLDLLTKILNSSDSWFNQDEKKFVQNSINRKRLIDLIIGSITIGAIIAAFFFNQLRINAQKQTARALTQSSQAFLANKQQIDTLVNAVGASRLVIEEKLEKTDIGSLAVAALRQAIYEFEINSLQSFFREHNRLIEHDNNITTVKFTPNNQITSDNQIIVSGSTDHTVKVWNTDGKLLDSFKHEHEVYSVAISPNNQLIVSGSGDSSGRVKVWKRNGESFDLLHNWKYKSTIFRVNFSPDGQNIAFVDIQGNIKIRNINGDLIESFRVKNAQEIIFSFLRAEAPRRI